VVDADTYLKRGESMMPFLRANLRRSEEQNRTLNQRLEEQGRCSKPTKLLFRSFARSITRDREAAEQSVDELIQGIKELEH